MAPVIIINPGTSKWDIREKVWAYIESKNLANYPRPVFNRIPNFKGAFTACSRVSELDVFTRAAEVKVDPDKPLEGARLAVLQAGKTLLVPTPRLRTGLFNKIIPPQGANKQQLHICASSQGVKLFSVPIELDAKLKVDLVVVGSVAVSEKGLRIGKGEGFADMEYGMMASMGALSDSTVVVTIVHDCQILDIPEELIESHDLTVDYILTPTRVIKTNCQRPKPQGIIWRKLSKEKLEKIPILRRLRAFEEKTLKDVSLGPTPIPAGPEEGGQGHRQKQGPEEGGQGHRQKQGPEEGGSEAVPLGATTVCLMALPSGLRVSELKRLLREQDAAPLKLTWLGAQQEAQLDYSNCQAAQRVLKVLQGLSLQAELSKGPQGEECSGWSH
uniref:Methenyltetrahydrofolate synthase domain-containing protein n=1 Tax=Takifugu rubripes TaxID=31033 RepID=H2VBJ5_TAKRU